MDEKFRYLIQFSKQGPLRFIGHLDLMRIFRQLIRRASLPVAYSRGFNPHQLISFALPLPLGMASLNDYAEIFFTNEPDGDEIANKLNTVAPEGLTVRAVKPFPNGPGVAAAAAAADYIWNAEVPEDKISELLSRAEIIVPKKTKSGIKDTDIRKDIYAITRASGRVTLRLSAGSQSFLNPLTAAGLFRPDANPGLVVRNADCSPVGRGLPMHPGQFCRAEMFKHSQDGTLIPLGHITGA